MLSLVNNIIDLKNICMDEGKSEKEINSLIKVYVSGLNAELKSQPCEKCKWVKLNNSSNIHYCPECGYVLPF